MVLGHLGKSRCPMDGKLLDHKLHPVIGQLVQHSGDGSARWLKKQTAKGGRDLLQQMAPAFVS